MNGQNAYLQQLDAWTLASHNAEHIESALSVRFSEICDVLLLKFVDVVAGKAD